MNRQELLDDLGFSFDQMTVKATRSPDRYWVQVQARDGMKPAGELLIGEPLDIGEGSGDAPGSVVGYFDRAVRGMVENWFLQRYLEGVNGVPVISRAYWRAEAGMRKIPTMSPPVRIVIHHTATPGLEGAIRGQPPTASESARRVQRMQAGHMSKSPPWWDIGYHFLVDSAGRVFRGRPTAAGELVVGSHLADMNRTSIGLALIGSFDKEKPTEAMLDAAGRLCRALCMRYGIDPLEDDGWGGIQPHNRFDNTICPGDVDLRRIRRQAAGGGA